MFLLGHSVVYKTRDVLLVSLTLCLYVLPVLSCVFISAVGYIVKSARVAVQQGLFVCRQLNAGDIVLIQMITVSRCVAVFEPSVHTHTSQEA